LTKKRTTEKTRLPAETSGPHRSGTVAIVGRPNVGKSTLLNAALGERLAIVSPVPQTTRDRILGILHRPSAEIALLDTPGLHKPHSQLGRSMNRTARLAAMEADVVVFVTSVPMGAPRVHPGDRTLLADIGKDVPTILAVNQIDRIRDKSLLLPLLVELAKLRDFTSIVPISALRGDGVDRVTDEVEKVLPEGQPRFEDDALTDRPTRFFVGEFVREPILTSTREEIPHAVAVEVSRFEEKGGTVHIDATIHVERDGQKRIVIGTGGEKLKAIGTAARKRIEALVDKKVFLTLWVKVTPDWTDSEKRLAELGYGK
jgi:GTP-binding protein Era